ncbi:MAG: hypothetical protein ABJC04_01865 [Verrucomicrobiota bacterium]
MFKITLLLAFFILALNLRADAPPKTPEDLARDASIAAFTKKTQDANYPALFARAAKEFNVPVEILEGVSFAETRWEHLQWPEGETVSPENGMPRAYGIMSLWDNEYFGHSLNEAAKLIGKSPEDLKNDPLDNMRGAAALLRQLYDKTPKPEGTSEGELESWRYAIENYSGLPEPDLKSQHGLEVYEHLSQGFDQFGIKMEKVPDLKLEPMIAEVKRIREEERIKRESKFSEEDKTPSGLAPVIRDEIPAKPSTRLAEASHAAETNAIPVATALASAKSRWLLIVLGAIAAVFVIFLLGRKKNPSPKN